MRTDIADFVGFLIIEKSIDNFLFNCYHFCISIYYAFMQNPTLNQTRQRDENARKSSLQLLLVYTIIGVVLYIGGYYFLLNRKEYRNNQLQAKSTQAQQMLLPTYSPTSPIIVPTTDTSINIYLARVDSIKGKYMTDFQGMTLYTYDKDLADASNCYNECAKSWPPYILDTTAQSPFPAYISDFKRIDGSMQFTWKGMPLYYYKNDTKVGDITGDGVGNVWHIVRLK